MLKQTLFYTILLVCLVGVMACEESTESSNQTDSTMEGQTDDRFYVVSIGVAANTVIEPGETGSYELSGGQSDLDKIEVVQKKGKLHFKSKSWSGLDDRVDIKIIAPPLEAVKLGGSGRVEVKEGVLDQEASLVLSGSGVIRANADQLESVDAILSGSGTIDLSGQSNALDVTISGSGDVKALDLSADNVDVGISGSGKCETDVKSKLKVRLTGSGSVLYTGDPQVEQRITGSGSVKRIE